GEGLAIFTDWAAKWDGLVDRMEDERVFATIRWPSVRRGWPELWRLAAKHGYDATSERSAEAQAEFAASPLTDPTVALRATAPLTLLDELVALRAQLATISDPLQRDVTRDAGLARLSRPFHI